jgi:uncharacterized membrane protein YbhN (UPF0104 family)
MILLRLFFAFFIFFAFLYLINIEVFINSFSFSFPIFFSASIFTVIFIFFQSWRLHILIKKDVDHFFSSIKLGFVGQFFSNFLPSGTGSDAYKLHFLKKNISIKRALAKVLFDKFAGFITLIFFSIIYFIFNGNKIFNFIYFSEKHFYLLLIIICCIFLFLIYFAKKMIHTFHSFFLDFQFSRFDLQNSTMQYLLICNASFFFRILRLYVIFYCLSYDFDFFDIVLLSLITQFSMLIPFTIGGLGIVEFSLFYTLSIFSVPEAIALSFCFYNRLSLFFVSLIGFFIWIYDFIKK